MKAQDKAKPVKVTVYWHPSVLKTAELLGKFYEDSDVSHVSSEAVLDAAKDKKFQEWLESHQEKTQEIRKGKAA